MSQAIPMSDSKVQTGRKILVPASMGREMIVSRITGPITPPQSPFNIQVQSSQTHESRPHLAQAKFNPLMPINRPARQPQNATSGCNASSEPLRQGTDAKGETPTSRRAIPHVRGLQRITPARQRVLDKLESNEAVLEEKTPQQIESQRLIDSILRKKLDRGVQTQEEEEQEKSQFDLESLSTDILAVVESASEHCIEHHIAEATAPFRANATRMENAITTQDSILASIAGLSEKLQFHASQLNRETRDFVDQNDTLSRQIGLHYENIERAVDQFHLQTKTMNKMIDSTAVNLSMVPGIISNLSSLSAIPSVVDDLGRVTASVNEQLQTMRNVGELAASFPQAINEALNEFTTNLPHAVNHIVYHCLQQHAGETIERILAAERDTMRMLLAKAYPTSPNRGSDRSAMSSSCNDIESLADTIVQRLLADGRVNCPGRQKKGSRFRAWCRNLSCFGA